MAALRRPKAVCPAAVSADTSPNAVTTIAEKYYGDMMKYKPLHKANISVIGPDPNKIEPRQKLWIPYPDELAKFN